jgi:hypothetical protein
MLELREALGQAIPFLTEGSRQRDHGVDQPTLAVVGGRNVGHGAPPGRHRAPRQQFGCRIAATIGAHLALSIVRRLTA